MPMAAAEMCSGKEDYVRGRTSIGRHRAGSSWSGHTHLISGFVLHAGLISWRVKRHKAIFGHPRITQNSRRSAGVSQGAWRHPSRVALLRGVHRSKPSRGVPLLLSGGMA